MPADLKPSFEDTLAELESLVDNLEQGDLPLEDSLSRLDQSLAVLRPSGEPLARSLERQVQTHETPNRNIIQPPVGLDD